MTQTGIVRRTLEDEQAMVVVLRASACGHDCSSCQGCSMSEKREVLVTAKNAPGAVAGDTVILESATKNILGAAFVVYLVPFILLFAAYLIAVGYGATETMATLSGILGFLAGLVVAVVVNRHVKNHESIAFSIRSIVG